MSKTVFILGAGASADGGVPVMRNFLDVARDIFDLNKAPDAKTDFERVFEAIAALKVVHSNSRLNIENIETLFAACEMAKLFGRFPGGKDDPAEVENILSSLRRLIVRTIEVKQQFRVVKNSDDQNALTPPGHYPDFVRLVKELKTKCKPVQTVSIITFNYDIGADFALVVGGCPPWYGFVDEVKREDGVPLLKLHGSIGWGISAKDKTTIVRLNIGKSYEESDVKFLDLPEYTTWPVSSFFGSNGLEPDPVIVPPTWNKADSHSAVEQVWKAAARELREAENIFVIGYSMPETDSFFQQLYALGTVGKAMLRRFWVFNPDVTVEKRFRQLLGPGAEARFAFNPRVETGYFSSAIRRIREEFSI